MPGRAEKTSCLATHTPHTDVSNRLLRASLAGSIWAILAASCSSHPADERPNSGADGGSAGTGADGGGAGLGADAGGAGRSAGAAGSSATLPACATCVTLPIEVLGPTGTTESAVFDLPAGAAAAVSLSLQVHGLAFQAMASVQVNDGAWLPLSNQTVRIPEHQARYGGIGGGFATLKLTLPLGADALRRGKNTVHFRFDKTDGRTEGFRVLRLNLLDASGAPLLDEATYFRDVDVSAWQPPSTSAVDLAAGERLWHSAALLKSPLEGMPIKAHCSDCHAQDARDLKYFNYSNHSIVERAKFHGLSESEGNQIASYVRSNASIAPGRPWNPPYQPGPGLTKQPLAAWSAGAGIDAVLDDDASGFASLPGAGKDVSALLDGKYVRAFDIHEQPLPLQLLDWNHWLPAIHPLDSLGDDFSALDDYRLYQRIRSGLLGELGKTKAEYVASGLADDLYAWGNSMTYTNGAARGLYDAAMPTPAVSSAQFLGAYFGATWNATKLWELMHEFELEGLGPQLFGSNGDPRSWLVNRHIFDVSPHIIHQLRPDQPFLEQVNTHGDCEPKLMNVYLANTWYAIQMQLNAGNRLQAYGGHHTNDWGYAAGLFGDLNRATLKSETLRRLVFTLKSFEAHDSSLGPEQPLGPWWTFNLRDASITSLALGEDWSDVPERDQYVQTALQAWLEKAGEFSVEQWLLSAGYDGSNFDPPTWVVGSGTGEQNDRSEASGLYNTLGNAQKNFKIHEAVLAGIARFGEALWPNNDWAQFHPAAPSAIGIPGGVSASPGVESATIEWQGVPNAASYNVLRATTMGGPYLTVAALRRGTKFTDSVLDPAVRYYYRVTANDAAFEGAPSAEVSVSPSRGLVGHWAFADPDPSLVTDDSGSNNLGQTFGNVRHVAGPGSLKAIELDGKSGFLSLRHSLHHWLGRSATLAAWIKTNAPGDSNYFTSPGLAGRAGGGQDEIYWGTIDAQGTIGMALGGGNDKRIASPKPINDGVWHHVAFSRDLGSGMLKVYVDGKVVATGTSDQHVYSARFFALGRTDYTTNYLHAALADVRVYDLALSDAEVAALAVIR